MSSRDLRPSNEHQEPASTEVQFALVISRMLETVKNHPEHMRQVVYDLARYKLQEQFTHADVKEMKRSKQALEAAIRGVEEFSQQQASLPPLAPTPPALPAADLLPNPTLEPILDPILDQALPARRIAVREPPSAPPRPRIDVGPVPVQTHNPPRSVIRWTTLLLLLVGLGALAIEQRDRLATLADYIPRLERQMVQERQIAAAPQEAPAPPASLAPPPKPNPLRPTDYGVYALVDDKALAELQMLPGRPPDIRVAVSAAFKVPNQAALPNGHPKFIVFRRETANTMVERAEVRVVARISREFSVEASGKKPEADDAWVIRNFSYPLRASPIPDRPEMVELHSEDPALELPPGRYALILKTQSYYFNVAGDVTDPRQCIERIVAANGTFYTDCKKP